MLIQKLLPMAYWSAALLVSFAAMVRGGRDERLGSTIMLAASVASVLVVNGIPVADRLHAIQTRVFLVDLVTLAAFVAMALRSERFWPLWTAAFQLVAVTTHAAYLADPRIVPRAYVLAQGLWAYPIWGSVLVGLLARQFSSRRRLNA